MTDTAVSLPPPGERGRLDIKTAVVETIAQRAAAGVSDLHHVTGLGRIVGSDLPRARVEVTGGQVRAELTVAAKWPTPVADLAERVRAAVTEQLQSYTGLTVTGVQVEVHCLSAPDHKVRRVL